MDTQPKYAPGLFVWLLASCNACVLNASHLFTSPGNNATLFNIHVNVPWSASGISVLPTQRAMKIASSIPSAGPRRARNTPRNRQISLVSLAALAADPCTCGLASRVGGSLAATVLYHPTPHLGSTAALPHMPGWRGPCGAVSCILTTNEMIINCLLEPGVDPGAVPGAVR